MKSLDGPDAYEWLAPTYQLPPCPKCQGYDPTCNSCKGSGRGAPVFSRTQAIRRAQEADGHAPCFGVERARRARNKAITPRNCGEPACPYRSSCVGLHERARYDPDRIREVSIELLSKVFLNARGIERRTRQLSPFQNEIAELVRQWADDTPQVALLGAFSAGKSTLVNRLLGRKLLPVGRTPTTAVLTSVRYGDRASGFLHFHDSTRVSLLWQDARHPDTAVISALRTWLRDRQRFGIRWINELDARGQKLEVNPRHLLNELDRLAQTDQASTVEANNRARGIRHPFKRSVAKIDRPSDIRLARTFEITFELQSRKIDIEDDVGATELHRYLTDPALALSLHRVVCCLPDSRLRPLNLLDTAGLCSPVSFHKEVTAELLKRRPDKLLVLLDSRRLDSPTNHQALETLMRFVSEPDDYRHVTFAMTFWDVALRTHMEDDSEPELDYDDTEIRRAADERFAEQTRLTLRELLPRFVGVPCPQEPTIFILGLGDNAPREMIRTVDYLWTHLKKECGGRVGVEMWADRWRDARSYGVALRKILEDTTQHVYAISEEISAEEDSDAQISRLAAQERQIKTAVGRSKNALYDVIASQNQLMLSEIDGLDSKSALLDYLDSGYWKSANTALNTIQKESSGQANALHQLHGGAYRPLRGISIDRTLLGLDASARGRARGEVSGFLYGLKSIWDFFLSGLQELNEEQREGAREILRGQVRQTMDLLEAEAETWIRQAERFREKALAQYDDRRKSIQDSVANCAQHQKKLGRKLNFLVRSERPVQSLRVDVENFANDLADECSRINSGRLGL